MSRVVQLIDPPETAAMPSLWRGGRLSDCAPAPENIIPLIVAGDATPILPGFDLWDLWPVQLADGSKAAIAGGTLWMILSAPITPDPNDRHGVARIRLMYENAGQWRDLGNLLPDGLCPGQREWAGSAVYDPADGRLTLYYTVAGRRGDVDVRFEQRLFEVSASLSIEGDQIDCRDWSPPREIIVADGVHYTQVDGSQCVSGFIKGFRDPAFFRDPADGRNYMVFTASLARSSHAFNGAIGIAEQSQDSAPEWKILPPLIDADGLNNELERPHLLVHEGLYYIFWSTQRHMFASAGTSGPTGLYGMVADSVMGPYRPLNGSGLVAGNPESEPRQTYSWWVCGDLSVVSFVDHWGLNGRNLADDEALNRAQFGGTPAPVFYLSLNGDCAKITTV